MFVIIGLFASGEQAFALYYAGGSGDGFDVANGATLYYHGGSGDGFDTANGANADVLTIGSIAQTFLVGDSATAISTITIEMEAGQSGGGINTTDDIRVKIPTSLDMVWDATDETAVIAGSASDKVSTTVSYEDSNKTLVIDVTTNFAYDDNITVSGLSFIDFNSVGYDNLELEIDNLGTTATTDSNIKTISLPASLATFTGGLGDGFDVADGATLYYHGGSGDGLSVGVSYRHWVASIDGNWNDTANWSSASSGTSGFSVPGSGQLAIFDSGGTKQCIVNIATVSLSDLIMESGYTGASAKVDGNANDITVTVNVTIAGGELELDASSDLAVTGNLTVSGGTLDGSNADCNIDVNGNVVVTGGTVSAPAVLDDTSFTVAGNWEISGDGVFTPGAGRVVLDAGATGKTIITSSSGADDFCDVTFNGAGGAWTLQDALEATNLTIASGTLTAGSVTITVDGDWDSSGGTFDYGTSTVTLASGTTATLTGNTNFYNLTCLIGGKTINFTAGSTQTISETLTLTGSSSSFITLCSTSAGTAWNLNDSGLNSVNFVDVADSDASLGNVITALNSTDSGNNIDWRFSVPPPGYPGMY